MSKQIFHKLSQLTLFLLFAMVLTNCTEPYTPDTLESDQQYVVEGYVEAGDGATPTYVLLTRSIPFSSTISQNEFSSLFVDNATMVVNDGDKDVELTKICTGNLPPEFLEIAEEFLGFEITTETPDICIYIDLLNAVTKEIGRSYTLTINVDGNVLTSTTSIPRHIPLFDFRWDDIPGEPNDTLARLWVNVDDPVGTDYYRYLTAINDRGYVAPFQSTTDDAFFSGQKFEFPLTKAEYPQDDTDPNSFGWFPRGDSVHIKWLNLDKDHFDFWTTRDFSANSGGPFSSYTRIAGNVDGALGIWGGYSFSQYHLFCPPR